MNQSHPFRIASQKWTFALRAAMGYPDYNPAFHTTTWCSSGRNDADQAAQLARMVADMGCDVIHVMMKADEDEPLGIDLAVRQDAGVEWLPMVQLYCASETARIELLAHDRRWFVGPRNVLASAKLPPKSRRDQGEQIAWRRWRQARAMQGDQIREGNFWVPVGGCYADALRHADLQIAD